MSIELWKWRWSHFFVFGMKAQIDVGPSGLRENLINEVETQKSDGDGGNHFKWVTHTQIGCTIPVAR